MQRIHQAFVNAIKTALGENTVTEHGNLVLHPLHTSDIKSTSNLFCEQKGTKRSLGLLWKWSHHAYENGHQHKGMYLFYSVSDQLTMLPNEWPLPDKELQNMWNLRHKLIHREQRKTYSLTEDFYLGQYIRETFDV